MARRIFMSVVLLFITLHVDGQTDSARRTLSNYSISQKRLLEISTAQFINFITQSKLDRDTVMILASQITGLSYLLPYNESFPNAYVSEGAGWANSGDISKARAMLKKQSGEKTLQILVELGIWYIHKAGNHQKDLDTANYYIQKARTSISNESYGHWKNVIAELTGEYAFQKGDTLAGKKIFFQLITKEKSEADMESLARTWQAFGNVLTFGDTLKLSSYHRSLEIYQKLKIKDKQIELLWNILGCNFKYDTKLMERDLRHILLLQKTDGFKHSLYAQSMLSYVLLLQAKFLDGFKMADAALENMKWSGITALSSNFYMRKGSAYVTFGKYEDALVWYKKGLENETSDTQLFWFTCLLNTAYCLTNLGRYAEAISLIQNTTKDFPPKTIYQKVQSLYIQGMCYDRLGKTTQADEKYTAIIKQTQNYDNNFSELSDPFYAIASFYISNGQADKARYFVKRALASPRTDAYAKYHKYLLLYKIDSVSRNYESAFQNHILYKFYNDSLTNVDVRTKLDALSVKFAAEKNNENIKLLKQKGLVQQSELKQSRLIKNITLAGSLLLLFISALLYNRFRLKQQLNETFSRKNKELENLVTEKEWLLKEVHHRVKNSLHTVICLLESQAVYLENDALKAIEISQRRIYAMSLIHQKLYQSADIKTIDMSPYLNEFIGYLRDSFETKAQITFHLEVQSIKLGVSQAMPLVLIINEAVTNAIKYAFPNRSNGLVEITMNKISERIILMISDNGVGIDSTETARPGSLGFKLMKGLSEDIGADFRIDNDNGTKITIAFSIDPLNHDNVFLAKTLVSEN
ncbi:tetratricopeptide repeat-containing sensor histidine kinase [Mucilaginibacter celer]|uniref:histidine kinase n=1 Tax=Mucilaginibacter celer TaxID=2305508 RepID=A0A494VJY5_9SPHI|nr:histidine kinase dimerization/phosphoacceptor domain -containing protein [Mucilaginibacter celer]AYL95406.1 hypothetical protein HYN43_008925 [Mucilaginibacter celer]